MDSLVKSLIRPLLEEKQPGVAIIPGGFKPPTSGHFYLANEVAKRPEVEKAIVLIGHKDRDGITKDQSLAIWNVYKKYLPSNVSIEISEKSSPVSDVHSLIKHNPENFYLPVVGIRGEEDLNDIKRFDSLKGKYDNFEPVVVKSDSTEERMSGTNARKAILDGDFESFQRFLPVELSDEDRKNIWNILTGETINEADPKVGTGKKPKGSSRRLYTDENPKDTVKVKFSTKQDIIDTLSKASFKSKSHARQSQIINLIHQRTRAAYGRAKDSDVKKRLKSALVYIEQRKETSKKKTERLKKQIDENLISKHLGTLKSKFKEFVKALKQEKQETKDAFKLLVQAVKNEKELSKEEKKQIGDQLKDVLKVAGFTAASILPGGIIYIMLTKIPALKKSLTPSAFINEGIDTRFDKVKFYFDYYTNVSPSTFEIVIEENNIKIGNIVEPYPSNFGPENVRQIPVNQNLEENIDPKAQSKHKGKAAPFGSAYKPVKEKKGFDKKLGKDPYGINQFARELLERSVDKTMYAEPSKFSYPTAMSSLIQHMLSKGMNIRPLPKVKFIDNDEENAQNFFGKTAYYNPDTKEITLFTMDRHPKDIMRSFAHEMIHHEQNCNGKLDNIQTQNTNEEGDLPEIEREAYEKGNMAFRNWTDSITEIKDPFGLVEFVKETFKENLSVEK